MTDVKTVREEIKVYANKYSMKLDIHPNIRGVGSIRKVRSRKTYRSYLFSA